MRGLNAARRRLRRLGNGHKWFVGGGRRVLWAPEFPLFLDVPGFWDPGTYLEIKLGSLLTYALIENGRLLAWRCLSRDWRPDRLTTRFSLAQLDAAETKTVTLDDEFRSEIELRNTSSRPRTLDLVMWGRVDASDTGDVTFDRVAADRQRISGRYCLKDAARGAAHELRMTWTLDRVGGRPSPCTSFAVQNSERSGETPDWRVSPFCELFDAGLPNTCLWRGGIEHRAGLQPQKKWIFVGLHRRLRLAPRARARLAGACRISSTSARAGGKAALPDWEGFYELAPRFECSDPYFERYFDYRWYGLRLNAVDYGRPPLAHPCVFEGINPGWFRHSISYSSQVLAKDCRWLRDPKLAQGCILNFLDAQAEDGFIPGGLLSEQAELKWHAGAMYHADWGGAVRGIHEVHPDLGFLRRCYDGFSRYAEHFDRERDAEDSGLYDVCDQAETGQEYMARYLFVDPRADEWGKIRLKGVDATVYVYMLKKALAWIAAQLGRDDQANKWRAGARTTADAVRRLMWDPRRHKFCDVDPQTGRRSPVKVLTDFYPFLTDIATEAHLPAIYEHLLNPREFWTEWPAPSTALDDKLSDAYGRWRGKRHICPWNGRAWLMTNSHIAEALANAALTLDPRLEPYAATFLTRFVRMLFLDRDPDRPTSYEYYNPLTAQPPFFRGTDDYMHSYIIDLIIRYVVGLRPRPDGSIVVEPLQFGLKSFTLDNCVIAGIPVAVKWDGRRLHARVGAVRKTHAGWGRLEFSRAECDAATRSRD